MVEWWGKDGEYGYGYGVMRCDRTWNGIPLGFVALYHLEEWRGGERDGMGEELWGNFVDE